jgi:hypothetical protein
LGRGRGGSGTEATKSGRSADGGRNHGRVAEASEGGLLLLLGLLLAEQADGRLGGGRLSKAAKGGGGARRRRAKGWRRCGDTAEKSAGRLGSGGPEGFTAEHAAGGGGGRLSESPEPGGCGGSGLTEGWFGGPEESATRLGRLLTETAEGGCCGGRRAEAGGAKQWFLLLLLSEES